MSVRLIRNHLYHNILCTRIIYEMASKFRVCDAHRSSATVAPSCSHYLRNEFNAWPACKTARSASLSSGMSGRFQGISGREGSCINVTAVCLCDVCLGHPFVVARQFFADGITDDASLQDAVFRRITSEFASNRCSTPKCKTRKAEDEHCGQRTGEDFGGRILNLALGLSDFSNRSIT